MVISEASAYQNPPPITQPWTAAMTGFVRCQRCKSSVTESRSRAHHRLMYSATSRSEEHTSELQSLAYLVCRLLLEKKKVSITISISHFQTHTVTKCGRHR